MEERAEKPHATRKKHRRLRVAAWSCGAAALLVVAAVMAVKHYIAPAVVRKQFQSQLADQWDGRADVGPVAFDWGGTISEAFARWFEHHDFDPRDMAVYACGPEPMARAVGDICVKRGMECQLALERHMACGMGTCQSCVVKVRDATPAGWSFKLCCADGPVFDAKELLW